MNIHCPQCGVKGSLNDTFVGKRIQCPKCKVLFVAGQESAAIESMDDEASAHSASVTNPTERGDSRVQDKQSGEELVSVDVQKGEELTEQNAVEPSRLGEDVTDSEKTVPTPETVAADVGSKPPPIVIKPGGSRDTAAGIFEEHEKMEPPGAGQGQDFRARKFSAGQALSEAWDLTRGVKAPIWGGLLITYGVSLMLIKVLTALTAITGAGEGALLNVIGRMISSALSVLFTAGLMFMGIKRATGREVVWKDVFSGFDVTGKVLIASLLQGVLVLIGFMLLVLPGIYLMMGYMLTLPLIIDKKMSPWQAMETSRKAIHTVWWKVFGLYFIILLVVGISAIPLGIGLIWTAPMSVILCGVVYAYLFTPQKKAE